MTDTTPSSIVIALFAVALSGALVGACLMGALWVVLR